VDGGSRSLPAPAAARPQGRVDATLEARLKHLALSLGFDLAGIAPAEPTPETRFLREWVGRGFAGEMRYLARRLEERVDPRRVLAGARSILAVGLVYDPGPRAEATPGSSEVARYAGGEDYHEVMLERLRSVEAGLEALAERPVRARAYVDTGPVQERVFAWLAGLGWIGKNTCLIHPRLGSYLFLGVLLTDLPLRPDRAEADHCGSCHACLDACPTDAFVDPFVLDATRCLSYTTIELRGSIPEALREPQADRLFGCDVCQEVCPWNTRRTRLLPPDSGGMRARLAPRSPWLRPTLEWVLSLDEPSWREASQRTALRRARFRGLLRNALVAAGNSGERALVSSVRRFAEGDDPLLAEHARWALARLGAG
jgi:epoxyqueuosine reductase